MAIKEITSQGQVKQGAAGPTGLILDRMTAAVTVNNTLVETNLYSFSIPANTLSTSRGIRFTPIGLDYLNNTGGNANFRYKLKLGATSIWDSGNFLSGGGTFRENILFNATGLNLGSASSQAWQGIVGGLNGAAAATGASPFTTGEGSFGFSLANSAFGWQNATAVDTTLAQTLAFTITMGTANALSEVKLLGAILELL